MGETAKILYFFLAICVATQAVASIEKSTIKFCNVSLEIQDHDVPGIVYKTIEAVDHTNLWSATDPNSVNILTYKNWVKEHTNPDPNYLLQLHRDLTREKYGEERSKRYDLILGGEAGRIEPATCLEKALLSMHLKHHSPQKSPAEFGAIAFRKAVGQSRRLKIYFISDSEPAISMGSFEQLIERETRAGWEYFINLHNHPFWFQSRIGETRGTTVPSGDLHSGDIAVFNKHFRDFGLQEAWITNGFDSIRLTQMDLEKLGSNLN